MVSMQLFKMSRSVSSDSFSSAGRKVSVEVRLLCGALTLDDLANLGRDGVLDW